jgi:hypothetical protein
MSTVSLHWFSDLARSVTPTFVKNFIIRNQGVNQFVSSIYSANGQLFVVFFPQTEGDLFLHSAWILINWDFPNLYWGWLQFYYRQFYLFPLQFRNCNLYYPRWAEVPGAIWLDTSLRDGFENGGHMIFFCLSRLLREEMVPLKSFGLVIFHCSSAVSNGVGVFELLVYFSMIKRCL